MSKIKCLHDTVGRFNFFCKALRSPTDLSVVVVGSAVLLLHVFSSGREEGQGVEVLVGGLLPAGHQLSIVEQLGCVAAAAGEGSMRGEIRLRRSETLSRHTLFSTMR